MIRVATADDKKRGMDELAAQADIDVIAQREERLRKELEAHKDRKAKLIDAVGFALTLGDEELSADEQGIFPWHQNAATPKQLDFLESFGFNPYSIKNTYHAGRLLDKILLRQRLRLATPKQLRLLVKHGHPNPERVSLVDAGAWLDKRFKALQNRSAAWKQYQRR